MAPARLQLTLHISPTACVVLFIVSYAISEEEDDDGIH